MTTGIAGTARSAVSPTGNLGKQAALLRTSAEEQSRMKTDRRQATELLPTRALCACPRVARMGVKQTNENSVIMDRIGPRTCSDARGYPHGRLYRARKPAGCTIGRDCRCVIRIPPNSASAQLDSTRTVNVDHQRRSMTNRHRDSTEPDHQHSENQNQPIHRESNDTFSLHSVKIVKSSAGPESRRSNPDCRPEVSLSQTLLGKKPEKSTE